MDQTELSRAVEQATAPRTERAELTAREFEEFLAGIVTGVIRNVTAVRAGELSAEDASGRDDATVRTLAQILMGEHERIRLVVNAGTPKPGPELVEAMRTNLPALFRDMEPGADSGNPRALMVHAARVFLREIYTMLRAAASEGTALSAESLRLRIGRIAFVWTERFLGDTLNECGGAEAKR